MPHNLTIVATNENLTTSLVAQSEAFLKHTVKGHYVCKAHT